MYVSFFILQLFNKFVFLSCFEIKLFLRFIFENLRMKHILVSEIQPNKTSAFNWTTYIVEV